MSTVVDGYRDVRQCPYNPAHQILSHRFQTHLVKCKRANPDIKLQVCPFNSTHHIRDVEFQAHKRDCPDRSSLDLYHYTLDVGTKSATANEPPKFHEEVAASEDWDDCNDPVFNPATSLEQSGVMLNRSYVGLKPAEKKKLREQELLRAYSRLKSEDHKGSSGHRRGISKHSKKSKGESRHANYD